MDFGNHNYGRRIKDVRGDEFGIVFQSFNNMAANIEKTELDLLEDNKLSEESRAKFFNGDLPTSTSRLKVTCNNSGKTCWANIYGSICHP